jgi:hypothetical protein
MAPEKGGGEMGRQLDAMLNIDADVFKDVLVYNLPCQDH